MCLQVNQNWHLIMYILDIMSQGWRGFLVGCNKNSRCGLAWQLRHVKEMCSLNYLLWPTDFIMLVQSWGFYFFMWSTISCYDFQCQAWMYFLLLFFSVMASPFFLLLLMIKPILLMLQLCSRAFLGRAGLQGKVKAMQTKSHSSHEFYYNLLTSFGRYYM